MARIKLNIPSNFIFTTKITVRITDINYGQHVGNDAMLSLLHEARYRFFIHHDWTENDIGGVGIILVDAALMFLAEVFFGDTLKIGIAAEDSVKTGCDLVYGVRKVEGDVEVARAKTGLRFFDYSARTIVPMPDVFRRALQI